jgi:hypothetical protein
VREMYGRGKAYLGVGASGTGGFGGGVIFGGFHLGMIRRSGMARVALLP